MEVLTGAMVALRAQAAGKEDAIRQAGEILVKAGCVAHSYVDGMLARERVLSTYLGSGIAIPHGELADLQFVHHAGVSVLQLPEGVEWEPGERAYLVIGLASTGPEVAGPEVADLQSGNLRSGDLKYVGVLASLVELLQTPEAIPPLIHATDPMVIVDRLTRGRSEIRWN